MTHKDEVWQALRSVAYPGYSRDIVSFGLVSRVAVCDGVVTTSLAIGHLGQEVQQTIIAAVRATVEAQPGVQALNIEVGRPSL